MKQAKLIDTGPIAAYVRETSPGNRGAAEGESRVPEMRLWRRRKEAAACSSGRPALARPARRPDRARRRARRRGRGRTGAGLEQRAGATAAGCSTACALAGAGTGPAARSPRPGARRRRRVACLRTVAERVHARPAAGLAPRPGRRARARRCLVPGAPLRAVAAPRRPPPLRRGREGGTAGGGSKLRRVKEESQIDEMRAALRGDRERAEQSRQRSTENVLGLIEPRDDDVAPEPQPEHRRGLLGRLLGR